MDKVIAIFDIPGLSLSLYDNFVSDLKRSGTLKQDLREYHVVAQNGSGLVVVDVWKSNEAFIEFGNALLPLFVLNGIYPPKPIVLPVYNTIT